MHNVAYPRLQRPEECLLWARSVVSDSSVTPRTAARQAPLFMGILQARILERVAIPPPVSLPWKSSVPHLSVPPSANLFPVSIVLPFSRMSCGWIRQYSLFRLASPTPHFYVSSMSFVAWQLISSSFFALKNEESFWLPSIHMVPNSKGTQVPLLLPSSSYRLPFLGGNCC